MGVHGNESLTIASYTSTEYICIFSHRGNVLCKFSKAVISRDQLWRCENIRREQLNTHHNFPIPSFKGPLPLHVLCGWWRSPNPDTQGQLMPEGTLILQLEWKRFWQGAITSAAASCLTLEPTPFPYGDLAGLCTEWAAGQRNAQAREGVALASFLPGSHEWLLPEEEAT